MDDKIVIKGVPPYDGEYPIDFETLTMGELHTLKRVAGVRVGEIGDALAAGDSDVVVAFALIAMQRAGKEVDEQAIWKATIDSISVEIADRGDAVPPAGAASEPPTSSGSSSEPPSDENPENDPSFTGVPV